MNAERVRARLNRLNAAGYEMSFNDGEYLLSIAFAALVLADSLHPAGAWPLE